VLNKSTRQPIDVVLKARPRPHGASRPFSMALASKVHTLALSLALRAALTILASPSNARKIIKLIIVIITNY